MSLATALAARFQLDATAVAAFLLESEGAAPPDSPMAERERAWDAALARGYSGKHPEWVVKAAAWLRDDQTTSTHADEQALGAALWRDVQQHRAAAGDVPACINGWRPTLPKRRADLEQLAVDYGVARDLPTAALKAALKAKQWRRDVEADGSSLASPPSQWSTQVTEYLVKHCLHCLGLNPRSATHAKLGPTQHRGFKVDFITDVAVIESKARTWRVGGTAGEKVYGVPVKYRELPAHYALPLKVVVLGRQEQELRTGAVPLIGEHVRAVHRAEVDRWKSQHIQYVPGSELLAAVGL